MSDIYGAGIFGADPDPTTPTGGSTGSTGGAAGGGTSTPPAVLPDNPNWTPADPGISLIGTNGDVILFTLDDTAYAPLAGATGFGIPPKSLNVVEGAGDGGVVRSVRTSLREIDLPVGIFGSSRGDVGEKRRRLASALRNRPGKPPARLRFVLETGDVYEIVVYYSAGGDSAISGYGDYCEWLLTLRCPDPYWTSATEEPLSVVTGGGGRGLLPRLSKLQLSSSQATGQLQVTNSGDVEADLTWTIVGPGAFSAYNELGQGFTLDAITAADTITVDTAAGTVTDQYGANRYGLLGDAPKLFKLPDGASTITVAMQGATSTTSIIGRYRPRREVVF